MIYRCGLCNEEFETYTDMPKVIVLKGTEYEREQFICKECKEKK